MTDGLGTGTSHGQTDGWTKTGRTWSLHKASF